MANDNYNPLITVIDHHFFVVFLLVIILLSVALTFNKGLVRSDVMATSIIGTRSLNKSSDFINPKLQDWVTMIDPSGSNIILAEFITKSLPECNFFHYKSINKDLDIVVRCFKMYRHEDHITYFLKPGQLAAFIGPLSNEGDVMSILNSNHLDFAGSEIGTKLLHRDTSQVNIISPEDVYSDTLGAPP